MDVAMFMLILKILAPLISYIVSARRERRELHDKSIRAVLRQTAWSAALAVTVSVGLAVEHGIQAEDLSASRTDAAMAREERKRITEALEEEHVDAEEARKASSARIVDLEEQLSGVQKYREVAYLDHRGIHGWVGDGLSWDSDLARAMKDVGAEEVFVHPDVFDKPPVFTGVSCPQSLAGKLSAITERHPTFPFAHFWLAQCALGAGDSGWVQHAERAMAIFRHTTQIEGHHRGSFLVSTTCS